MSEQNPKISVITVCYNAANTIKDTILSVLNQTYNNIEYIIIDGNSTDGTLDIIREYSERIAYIVSEPDRGIYDAMNKGIKIASGNWINFMNAGDSYYSDHVLEQITNYMSNNNSLYYGDAWVNSIKKRYWGKFTSIKLSIGNICHQSIFYPTIYLHKNPFDINYKIFADYVLNLKGWRTLEFVYMPLIICNYEFNDGISFTQEKSDMLFNRDKNKLIIDSCGYISWLIGIVYRFLLICKKKICK